MQLAGFLAGLCPSDFIQPRTACPANGAAGDELNPPLSIKTNLYRHGHRPMIWAIPQLRLPSRWSLGCAKGTAKANHDVPFLNTQTYWVKPYIFNSLSPRSHGNVIKQNTVQL